MSLEDDLVAGALGAAIGVAGYAVGAAGAHESDRATAESGETPVRTKVPEPHADFVARVARAEAGITPPEEQDESVKMYLDPKSPAYRGGREL